MLPWTVDFFFQETSFLYDPYRPCVQTSPDTDACGSGFAFVVQSRSGQALGGKGSNLGYGGIMESRNPNGQNGDTTTPLPINCSIIVEFDFEKSANSSHSIDLDGTVQNHIFLPH